MSQAIQAIAIDDEPKALEVIQIHAEKVPFLELKAMFTNAFEALDYLRTNQVDLIFLEISSVTLDCSLEAVATTVLTLEIALTEAEMPWKALRTFSEII